MSAEHLSNKFPMDLPPPIDFRPALIQKLTHERIILKTRLQEIEEQLGCISLIYCEETEPLEPKWNGLYE